MKRTAINIMANIGRLFARSVLTQTFKQTTGQEVKHTLAKVEEHQAKYGESVLANLALTV